VSVRLGQVNVDLSDTRFTAIGLLTETFTGLRSHFEAHLERHRLSLVEFEVLMRLARSHGQRLRMTELAGQTSLSTSGVTRVVDRMDREGLIRREACASDRRSSYAVITDAGLERLDGLLPEHLEIIQRWLIDPLTPGQLDGLMEGLRNVRDAVNPCATAGSGEPAELPAEPASA
jgi:MarR family transcriptional regulator, 2-MHQ and catechol-resistance regulon repressor